MTCPLPVARLLPALSAGALLLLATSAATASHPGVIVRPEEYPELRTLATIDPWATMHAAALADVGSIAINPDDSVTIRANRLSQLMSANALAYVLEPDPAARRVHLGRIDAAMTWWDPSVPGNLRSALSRHDWTKTVPPGAALVNSLLAFDIIEEDPDYPQARRTAVAALLASAAQWYEANPSSWKLSDHAVRGFWALYQREDAKLAAAASAYRAELRTRVTPDGGYNEGTGYAMARSFFQDREHKHFFLDALEYNGDRGWYSDSHLRDFHEWLVGHALTPGGQNWLFGDTAHGSLSATETGSVRAHHFGPLASAGAGHIRREGNLPGRLLAYLTLARATPEPASPPRGRLVPDTGAFLRESAPGAGTDALAAVLWSCTTSEAHSHKEANSLNLAGHGQLLLGNAGYTGWGRGAGEFTWDYINRRAVSANTALIGYAIGDTPGSPSEINDHASKIGGGVTGILGDGLDLVTADAGPAIANGRHQRTLAFVHSQDGQPGYFVAFDELHPDTPGQSVQLAWHPLSRDSFTGNLTALVEDRHYQAKITSPSGSDTGVRLETYLATPPRPGGVVLQPGAIGGFGTARFLLCDYETSGPRTLATVHYPRRLDQTPPSFAALSAPGYSGVRVGALDHAVAGDAADSPSSPPQVFAGVTLNTRATVFRKTGPGITDPVRWYAAKGFLLKDAAPTPTGFSSGHPVHVLVKDDRGALHSTGRTAVSFFQPGRTGLLANGNLAASAPIDGETGFRVVLEAGQHDLAFVSPVSVAPAADAYVNGGNQAARNFGTATALLVKEDVNDSYDRRAFLRFDLTGLSAPAVRATLRLTPTTLGAAPGLVVKILRIDDQPWDETSLNWNNQPASADEIGTLPGLTLNEPAGVDVTAALNDALRSGATSLSLAVLVSGPPGSDRFAVFASREHATPGARPALLVLPEDALAAPARLAPAADAHVNAGAYSSNNYGSAAALLVKEDPNADYDRRAFLRFDFPPRPRPALRARLRLTPVSVGPDASLAIEVRDVPGPPWGEHSLTHDNQPATGAVLATVVSPVAGTPVEVDVTSALNALPAGSVRFSVALVAATPPGANRFAAFASAEHPDPLARPALVILEAQSER